MCIHAILIIKKKMDDGEMITWNYMKENVPRLKGVPNFVKTLELFLTNHSFTVTSTSKGKGKDKVITRRIPESCARNYDLDPDYYLHKSWQETLNHYEAFLTNVDKTKTKMRIRRKIRKDKIIEEAKAEKP